MAEADHPSSDRVVLVAGGLVAASGLVAVVALLGTGDRPVLLPLSDVALALGVGALALGRSGIVGTSRWARAALLVFGVGPLVYRLEPPLGPWLVLIGMSTIAVVTAATVATAVLVARIGRVHGLARWALLLVAADALLTALMSTVPLQDLAVAYLGGHLELVRPAALLAWGLALVLQARAIRTRRAALAADWRRSTDIGGAGGL